MNTKKSSADSTLIGLVFLIIAATSITVGTGSIGVGLGVACGIAVLCMEINDAADKIVQALRARTDPSGGNEP